MLVRPAVRLGVHRRIHVLARSQVIDSIETNRLTSDAEGYGRFRPYH